MNQRAQSSNKRSYQNQLRTIGRHLDEQHFHRVSILEVEDGFIAHGRRQSARHAEGLEFPRSTLEALNQEASKLRGGGQDSAARSELAPTGYEDLLRAIGYDLDTRPALHIVITELHDMLLISGTEPNNTPSGHTAFDPFHFSLNADGVRVLLDRSFNRRNDIGFLERRRKNRYLKKLDN